MGIKPKRNNSKSILKTISIPIEVYTLIEKLAKETKVSVHTCIIDILKYQVRD